MTDFDIKSFIEQNKNVILVTNYWSKNDIPFYIIRPKEGHFLKFEDHSNKMFEITLTDLRRGENVIPAHVRVSGCPRKAGMTK